MKNTMPCIMNYCLVVFAEIEGENGVFNIEVSKDGYINEFSVCSYVTPGSNFTVIIDLEIK